MRIRQQVFSAHVELPCKIFCGPESLLEVAGIAVKIGPASVQMRLGGRLSSWQPVVGEALRLELRLPADGMSGDGMSGDGVSGVGQSRDGEPSNGDQAGNGDHGKARYLSARATVAEVSEQPEGTFWLELRFRKPIFKEGTRRSTAVALNGGAAKWKM